MLIEWVFSFRQMEVTKHFRLGSTSGKRGSTIDDLSSTVHGSSLVDSLESNSGSNDTKSLGE